MFSDKELYNMSLRELKQYTLIQKLHIFYSEKRMKKIDKDIRDGKLIKKKDLEEFQNEFIEFTVNKFKNNMTSETQVQEIILCKSEEQVRKLLNKRFLASFLEIAYLNLNEEFKMSTKLLQSVFREELNKKIESIINIKLDKDENKSIYIKQIINFLDTTEDIIRQVIDEINSSCEFKKVIIFIVACDSVAELPKRDRKKLYEEKRKFDRRKETTISNLKALNLPFDEVEKKVFSSPETLGWHNYETTLKHYKLVLLHTLINDCKTGKKRANQIIKILDYL